MTERLSGEEGEAPRTLQQASAWCPLGGLRSNCGQGLAAILPGRRVCQADVRAVAVLTDRAVSVLRGEDVLHHDVAVDA
ncbi:MAG TPA: hypothetical protein PKD61_20750, partial [Polyangiaceae bacterium]|nr:hypothetical protein [Polyangiaceae bacterium]